jgi:hypothetical protein
MSVNIASNAMLIRRLSAERLEWRQYCFVLRPNEHHTE